MENQQLLDDGVCTPSFLSLVPSGVDVSHGYILPLGVVRQELHYFKTIMAAIPTKLDMKSYV